MYIEDKQEWEVSGILRHKGLGEKKKYLVSYTGYDKSKACWPPEIELHNALETLNDYKVPHGLK